MVDAPLGTSNPEGSDVGLGLKVPYEPPSHGRDLAQVGGRAIPAILYGNQYAVPYNTVPTDIEFLHGVQLVIIFDFTWIWIDSRLCVCQPDCLL